ncbi:UPF0585 protein CG18661 [Onthophagus taurus]|uniref:UPF0585 protein CG18661 n=1 Tax=Onthophagus taurus TaxID=166361 RepID=UPI0039BDDFE3
MSKKIFYPATERNKPHILKVLQNHLNETQPGNLLEIASGTGQHVSFFAPHFPSIQFQPSEYDGSLLKSIKAFIEDTATKNIRPPLEIDVTTKSKTWNLPVEKFDYLLNVNMVHISPYKCTEGLFQNAGDVLKDDGLMIMYGPYANNGVIEPQSNIDFDRGLRSQNPEWGLRDIEDLKVLADKVGIKLLKVYDLPSNNKCLVWVKIAY